MRCFSIRQATTRTSTAPGASATVGPLRVDLVDRDEGAVGRPGGGLDPLAAAGEAVDRGEHAGDLEALLPDPPDRRGGRAAGGDGVLDDQAAGAGLDSALDPALEAVLLAGAADEEAGEARRRPGTAIAAQASGIAAVAGPPTASAPASSAAAAISSPAARKPAGRRRARRAST